MATVVKKTIHKTYSQSFPIYLNDGISICSEACSCCWDKPIPETYDDKIAYLAKRVATGHTSILEHSNIIGLIKLQGPSINANEMLAVIDLLSCSKYLNICWSQDRDNTPYILIGGSYRGYIEAFKQSKSPTNSMIMRAIANYIYPYGYSAIFKEPIDLGCMNEDLFANLDRQSIPKNMMNDATLRLSNDKISLISFDNAKNIAENVKAIVGEQIFTEDDYKKVSSLTILFKDMSRTATHQLVRHRNAITQESQRYVDYSNAAFADPATFKPDKYDASKKYNVNFAGQTFSLTSMELGEAIAGTYESMREEGMLKEDARSYLPGNIKCRKLYMTFTRKSFDKFLELRCDPHAQAEIRSFAISCRDNVLPILDSCKPDSVDPIDGITGDKEVIAEQLIKNTPELANNEGE